MKIEFENGSVIETVQNVDVTRGKRSEFIEWVKYEENEENE